MLEPFIEDILKEYEQKRDAAEKYKIKRTQEVYNKIPRIEAIDKEMQKIGLSLTRAVIHQPENAEKILNHLKSQLDELKQEKAVLLTDNNIPLEYLDESFQCNYCKDTGYLSIGTKCTCFKQKVINYAYAMSNLSNTLEKENFQTFNISLFSDQQYEDQSLTPKENMLTILNSCEDFIFNFDQNNGENLLFYGDTGLGKTFMANCIAKSLLDKGKIVVYQTAFKVLEILAEIRFQNHSDKQKVTMLLEADLLIIDDLGTEITNTFTNSELFNIINSRLLSNKKMIISTNLTPGDIAERYDVRIFSRLISKFTPLYFYGKDLRWENQ
jgi:DNA replication protein DnaC